MAAYCTTKCPSCDGVTSHFKDSTLTEDRVEYDGKRCRKCTAPKKKHEDYARTRIRLSGNAIRRELNLTTT